MSARAIIYRAHSLNLISAQHFRSANVYLNKSGQTKFEKFDGRVAQEKPELLENSIELLSTELGISFSRIADELGVSASLLTAITGYIPNDEHLHNVQPISLVLNRH